MFAYETKYEGGGLKMKIKAYRRNFYDEVVLIDESRRVIDPQVGYVVSAAYPAVGVSVAGETREFILPIDDEFWSAAEEIRNQAVISTAIANCGGEGKLDSIFSQMEKKIRG
jgi:hypothetical protein